MDLIKDNGDTRPRRVMVRSIRTAKVRMPSLAEAAHRLDGPPPSDIDPDAYAVLRAVWQTFPRAATAWRSVIPPDQVSPERWRGLEVGTPLLDESLIRWEAAPLRQQHGRLLRLFRAPVMSRLAALGDLHRCLTVPFPEPLHWARLFFQSEVNDPRPELLLGGYVIQPFLYAFTRLVLPRLRQEDWRQMRCPVCKGRPYHGYLHPQSRQKILICGKCQCPWIVPRLECPFCANTAQDSLGYLYQEGAAQRRIDYCTACRSILPISPYPISGYPFPLYDHLTSLPLQAAVEWRENDA